MLYINPEADILYRLRDILQTVFKKVLCSHLLRKNLTKRLKRKANDKIYVTVSLTNRILQAKYPSSSDRSEQDDIDLNFLSEASNDGLLMPFVRLLMISNIIDQVFSI
jgi:hypothetical protein